MNASNMNSKVKKTVIGVVVGEALGVVEVLGRDVEDVDGNAGGTVGTEDGLSRAIGLVGYTVPVDSSGTGAVVEAAKVGERVRT